MRAVDLAAYSDAGGDRPGPITRLTHHRHLLRFWVQEELKQHFYGTRLGPLWIILRPLLMTMVFTIAFTVIARIGSRDVPYPLFFLAGYVPWHFFSSALSRSSAAIIKNLGLIKHHRFPRELLVVSTLLTGTIDLLVGAAFVAILMLVYDSPWTRSVLLIPVVLLIQFVLTFGASLWLSAATALQRDIRVVIPSLLQGLFYLSPVIYPVAFVPERFKAYYLANPMAAIVVGYRDALFSGRFEHAQALIVAAVLALLVLVTGYLFFRARESRFADLT